MKKIISTILALMLVFSMTMTAFASEVKSTEGSITINGVSADTDVFHMHSFLRCFFCILYHKIIGNAIF